MRSLWLHGWASDSSVFGPLLATLPPALAGVAETLDLPGFGPDSAYVAGTDFPAWLAEQLRARREAGPLVLGGWSLGAMLALEAAAAEPESVAGMVLISGCGRFVRDDGNPCGQDPRAVRAMTLGIRRDCRMVVRDFLGTLFSPTEKSGATSFQQQCEQTFTKINPAALSAGLNYLLTAELTGRLGAISCPVLLLHGSADTVIDLRLAESLAAALTESRLEVLEGAGHAPLWSRAETCAYLAAEFIETLG